jgi:hypothetical protein
MNNVAPRQHVDTLHWFQMKTNIEIVAPFLPLYFFRTFIKCTDSMFELQH